MLDIQFLLSLYCLQPLLPKRGTSYLWLSKSLAVWMMLIVLSTIHVSAIFPFKGKSSTAPLIVFPHLYISKQFLKCQPMHPAHPGAGPTGHRTCCTTQHTSQVTCHSGTLASGFTLFLLCTWLTNQVTNGGFTMKSMHLIAIS